MSTVIIKPGTKRYEELYIEFMHSHNNSKNRPLYFCQIKDRRFGSYTYPQCSCQRKHTRKNGHLKRNSKVKVKYYTTTGEQLKHQKELLGE
jgi:hypothetical protein